MKFTAILVALGSASFVVAKNCTPGLQYCGRTLLCIGNYIEQMDAAVKKAKIDPNHVLDTLYYRVGGTNGDIRVIKDCGAGACIDGGEGNSDRCAAASRIHLIFQAEENRYTVEEDEGNMWQII
ncbi:hypothetical protein C8J57DRAFT_1719866 [Mycena rebaudengoi]|nr:hypothetical protein C8J57DRAFT_1719866 [Mycena rebaudengoi]